MKMTIEENGVLVIHQFHRSVILDRVTESSRINALIIMGCEPGAAPLIVSGIPKMFAKVIALLGWKAALEGFGLTREEWQQGWRWLAMRQRQNRR